MFHFKNRAHISELKVHMKPFEIMGKKMLILKR